MANQNNQTNKTPVLFVQPFADGVTMDKALYRATCKAFPKAEETEERRQVAAALCGLIRNPAATMIEDRKMIGGYFVGAGMICEAVAELLQDNEKDEDLQEQFADCDGGKLLAVAASFFYGAARYLVRPKYVTANVKPFPFIVEAFRAPNEFTQNEFATITAVLKGALQAIRVLRNDAGLQEVFADNFTENDLDEAEALIGLIRAALPFPREIMEERSEYYADENGGEA